jgi:hypothetical protein
MAMTTPGQHGPVISRPSIEAFRNGRTGTLARSHCHDTRLQASLGETQVRVNEFIESRNAK